jgi:hypothetical protein
VEKKNEKSPVTIVAGLLRYKVFYFARLAGNSSTLMQW